MKMQYTPMNVSQKCQLTERLVHHAADHLRHPEIRSGEDPEDGGDGHDEVEVSDDEVGGVQIGVNRWLRQEETADAAADEHGDETEAEERRRWSIAYSRRRSSPAT